MNFNIGKIYMTDSYEKYSGKMYKTKNEVIKKTMNRIKGDMIDRYEKKSKTIIDVGIGRGTDLKYYALTNVRRIIGIEPSRESFEIAINRLKSIRRQNKLNGVRVSLLNGVGEKSWKNGTAGLTLKEKNYFRKIFNRDKLKADAINLFATIHYMMDSEVQFSRLLGNIDRHLNNQGLVMIICLNGEKLHKLLKKNNGVYSIKDDGGDIMYEIKSKYEGNPNMYGSKIEVYFKGVYGLDKGIEENMVMTKDVSKIFQKMGFNEVINLEYSKLSKETYKSLLPFEKKIMDIYKLILLEKN